jgi:hypothetical protein
MKIALTTTFPNALDYPKESLESWLKYLPEDLTILIGLDPCKNLPKTEEWLIPLFKERTEKETAYLSRDFEKEQIEFLQRNKEISKSKEDYRFQYVRFSFKVFTLYQAMLFAIERDYDYLVWLDADIVIKKNIEFKDIEEWLPKDGVASYLGRKDWDHSECGFMVFNLKNGGKEFITRLRNMYLTDEVLTLPQWHDSFVFDHIRAEFISANKKDVFLNLTKDVAGRDVFDNCVLSKFMEHKKGNKKFTQNQNGAIDLNDLKVQTKNCVDHDIIQKNIKGNLELITNWVDVCAKSNEEIVIVNAGPSLCAEDIRPFYDKGVKIVAVKHALSKLLDAGIIPWACVLLDPREHVKDFVKHPKANQVNWFVASMVSPEVTKELLDQDCKVFGYHAYVGADEQKILPKEHVNKMIAGGSATATRGIALLNVLGFSTFYLFAYDLCSFEIPDFTLKKGDRSIWTEVTLKTDTASDEQIKRTFWTKGEFLAQVQEMRNFFQVIGLDKFKIYGEGIIPWIYRNLKLREKWLQYKNNTLSKEPLHINALISNYTPLKKGSSSKVISANIKKEMEERKNN